MNGIIGTLLLIAAGYLGLAILYSFGGRWYRIWRVRREVRRSLDADVLKRAARRHETEAELRGHVWPYR